MKRKGQQPAGGAAGGSGSSTRLERIEGFPSLPIMLTNSQVPRETRKLVAGVRHLREQSLVLGKVGRLYLLCSQMLVADCWLLIYACSWAAA